MKRLVCGMKLISFLLLLASGMSLTACDNDDNTVGKENLQALVSGKFFVGAETGKWLKKSGDNLLEVENLNLGGTGPIITGSFWFTDEMRLLVPAVISESAIIETSLDFKWRQYLYDKGEEIHLFVETDYRYDPSTGRFSTENLSLVREKNGSSYYIERISGKDLTIRIEFKDPFQDDIAGFRLAYKESLSPTLRPYFQYKVFNSNDEAIAYVKKLLGE